MPPMYRAEQVGSLLWPKELLDARRAHASGALSRERLREEQDRAILAALARERAAGLDVLTDGEYRRNGWWTAFIDGVDGYVAGEGPIRMRVFTGGAAGAPPKPEATHSSASTRLQIIGGKLAAKGRLVADEAAFLGTHAGGPYKVTLPAPSFLVARGYKPGVTDRVYPSRAAALEAVAAIVNAEAAALVAQGVPYVQLDNPHYADYIGEGVRDQMRALGIDPDRAIRDDIEGDNAALRGLDRSRVTLATHLCRGNGPEGSWHTQGGYDRIAEQVFGGLEVDAFLLEFDGERAGTFAPLRHMPPGKRVVLGLVTTKSGALESSDLLRRRIDEAAKYVPLESLALSAQCGFASTPLGSPLTADEQWRKLELVAETARKVWG